MLDNPDHDRSADTTTPGGESLALPAPPPHAPEPPSTPVHGSDPAQEATSARWQTAMDVLGGIIAGDQPLVEVLHLIAELAVATVEGIDEASVTLYRDGAARTAGFAGPHAAALDERQYQTGSGPCLRAARTGSRVLVSSTEPGRSGGFEDFAYHARRAGVSSATCLPLPAPGRVVGALNTFTYGGEEGVPALQGAALGAAEAFAAVAAVAVASAANVAAATEAAENMRAAMEHRAVIEQAKGVLMAQLQVDPEAAFLELRRLSQRDNVKLREVALRIVAAILPGERAS